jgi:hypothetical protein
MLVAHVVHTVDVQFDMQNSASHALNVMPTVLVS